MHVKAERKVDTVIVEMDSAIAEKLSALLGLVASDDTCSPWADDMSSLHDALCAHVRYPSPLYHVEAVGGDIHIDWARHLRTN